MEPFPQQPINNQQGGFKEVSCLVTQLNTWQQNNSIGWPGKQLLINKQFVYNGEQVTCK